MIFCTTRNLLPGLVIAASVLTGCAVLGPTLEPIPEEQAQHFIDKQTHVLKGPGNFRLHSHYREYTEKSANYYTFGNFRCNGATRLRSVEVYRISEDDHRNVRVDATNRSECDSEAKSYTLVGRHNGERLFLRNASKPSKVYEFRLWALPSPYHLTVWDSTIPDKIDTEFLNKPPHSGQNYFHFFAQEGYWQLEDGQLAFTAYPTPPDGPDVTGRTKTLHVQYPGSAQDPSKVPRFTFVQHQKLSDDRLADWYTGYYALPEEVTGTRLKSSDPTPAPRKIESSSYLTNQLNATLGTMQRLNQQTQQGLATLQPPVSTPSRSSTTTTGSAASSSTTNSTPKASTPTSAAPKVTSAPPTSGTPSVQPIAASTGVESSGKSGKGGNVVASARVSTPSPTPATAAQTPAPEDDGCQTNVGWCASSGEKREGNDFSVGVTNTCPMRLLTKICIELKDGKWSCSQDGHLPGKRTSFSVSSEQSTGRYTVRSVGSSKAGKDWVCSAKVPGWNTQ